MRRLCLALVLVCALVIVAGPASAERTKTRDTKESSNVTALDPDAVVKNKAESVQPGFDGDAASASSPCSWELQVEDDLKDRVAIGYANTFVRVRTATLPQETSQISHAPRAYSAEGRWWRRTCPEEDGPSFTSTLLPEGEAVTIEELILRSIGVLDPPDPVVGFDPDPAARPHIVQIPSLFWVDPVYWDVERTDTQAVGRVVSTVDLVADSSVWDPGDGNDPVFCEGPGQQWQPNVDEDDFDTVYPCKHIYKTVEGSPFTVTSTVNFDIQVNATVDGAPAPENLGPYEFIERTTTSEIATTERQVVTKPDD